MDLEYLNQFEQRLEQQLLHIATTAGLLKGQLLSSPDIDNRWHDLAPEYMADAVPQVASYPMASLAWASYLGLAVAYGWDSDWLTFSRLKYTSYHGSEGFDNMDDHIMAHILGIPLNNPTAQHITETLRRLAETTLSAIRHEQIEPQSPMAFHTYARAVRVMFRLGAAIQLGRMGYKFEEVKM